MRRITQLAAKLNYNQIIIDASNRFHAIVNACMNSKDYPTIAGLTCSSMYSSEEDIPAEKEHPVLDQDFCFRYRSYAFKLSSCNNITNKEQILGLTNESFKEWFPNGVFTDRYVCWMFGYENCNVYLVPGAWSWGAESDLRACAEVSPVILEAIDKFLETFKE
jgi:hypothetical protein